MQIAVKDIIEAVGISFWINVVTEHGINDIDKCQDIINRLHGHLEEINDGPKRGPKFLRTDDLLGIDCDPSVLILLIGIGFWRHSVREQNIKDIKHCSVIINYLNDFLAKKEPKEEKTIIKCRESRVMLEKIKVPKDEPDNDIKHDELMDDNDLEFPDHPSDDDSIVNPKVEAKQNERVNDNQSDEDSDYDPKEDIKSISFVKNEDFPSEFEGEPEERGDKKDRKFVCSCDYCDKKFLFISDAKNHYTSTHPDKMEEFKEKFKNNVCQKCKKSFYSLKSLYNHYRRIHNMKKKKVGAFNKLCTECGKKFTSKRDYEDHLEEHKHGLGTLLFTCSGCGKRLINRTALVKHQNHRCSVLKKEERAPKKRKTGNFLCNECGQSFIYKTEFTKHKAKHWNQAWNLEPRTCGICNKTFKTTGIYQLHAYKEHDVAALWCDVCGMKARGKVRMEMHRATHFEKSVQCTKCENMFYSQHHLNRHMKTYHPDKPWAYVCSHCGKGFMIKPNYEAHVNVHLGLKPHVCDICQAAFSDKSNLFGHKRKVHNEGRAVK